MKKELAGASSASSVEVHTDRNPGISCLKPRATRGKGGGGGEKKPTKPTLFAYESRRTGGGGGETRAAYANRHGIPLPFLYLRAILPPLLSPIPKPFFQTTKESNHVLFITRFSARGKFSLPSSFSLSLSFHFLGERERVRDSETESERER